MGLLELPVAEFLDQVAAHTPAPGGGGVAAVATGMAAGLAAMVARFSEAAEPGQFAADVAAADLLRHEVGGLADADAAAYSGYLAAVRRPKDEPGRREAIAAATNAAADVPLAILTAAAATAELGARLAREGTRRLRGDAASCALLAGAAARAAALLVQENLARTPQDPRLAETRQLVARAERAADTVRKEAAV